MLTERIIQRLQNRKRFQNICHANKLRLNYSENRRAIPVLEEVFTERAYALYFPFYQKSTIVDIGAHYGFFSIFASINSHPASSVYAYEPFPANFAQLNKNIHQCEIHNVKTYPYAISNTSGRTTLYSGMSVNNSLIRDFRLLNQKSSRTFEIQSKTLEAIIHENTLEHIDFLKMDCEGSEYGIFESTPKEIFDSIATLSMEFHDVKSEEYHAFYLISELKKHGFDIVHHSYNRSNMGLNFGKLVGTKLFRRTK